MSLEELHNTALKMTILHDDDRFLIDVLAIGGNTSIRSLKQQRTANIFTLLV